MNNGLFHVLLYIGMFIILFALCPIVGLIITISIKKIFKCNITDDEICGYFGYMYIGFLILLFIGSAIGIYFLYN